MIRVVETKNYSYALDLAEKEETKTRRELGDELNKNLYKIWEVYQDEKRIGVVFSCFIDGIYTLDGYNETQNFMAAVIAGKIACGEIFKVTDVIWTSHLKSMKAVTLLTLRIGFRIQNYKDNFVFLKKEKIWA